MSTHPEFHPEFRLEEFTPYRLARAAQLISDRFAVHYRDRFGLSVPDWRVLVHISDMGGASVRDIEARVGMEKSKVSRAATRLESRGLLAKAASPGDKRLISLRLTAQGEAVMAELLPLARRFQAELEAELGSGFAALQAGLDALLDKSDAQARPQKA